MGAFFSYMTPLAVIKLRCSVNPISHESSVAEIEAKLIQLRIVKIGIETNFLITGH